MKVYFDNAATTPVRPVVIESMVQVMKNTYANASATYGIGRSAKAQLETSRKSIAELFGVLAKEIVFTSGGTESNNIILQGAVSSLGVKRIITSSIEHHAVLKTVEYLAERFEVVVEYVRILKDGTVDYKHLEKLLALRNEKTLVSLMHINNETGVILDLETVGDLCSAHEAFFHSDTVQTIGHFEVDFRKVKLHFATASAHKFYGPKGVGFAYISRECKLHPLQYGGEQERGARAGTESLHQIVGMQKALSISYNNLVEEAKYILELKNALIASLNEELPSIRFNTFSNQESRNYNLLNILLPIPSEKANTVLFELDLAGIAVSRGSACQSGSIKPSHVLIEILDLDEIEKTSLRLSFSIYNTKEEVMYFVEIMKKIISKYSC